MAAPEPIRTPPTGTTRRNTDKVVIEKHCSRIRTNINCCIGLISPLNVAPLKYASSKIRLVFPRGLTLEVVVCLILKDSPMI